MNGENWSRAEVVLSPSMRARLVERWKGLNVTVGYMAKAAEQATDEALVNGIHHLQDHLLGMLADIVN